MCSWNSQSRSTGFVLFGWEVLEPGCWTLIWYNSLPCEKLKHRKEKKNNTKKWKNFCPLARGVDCTIQTSMWNFHISTLLYAAMNFWGGVQNVKKENKTKTKQDEKQQQQQRDKNKNKTKQDKQQQLKAESISKETNKIKASESVNIFTPSPVLSLPLSCWVQVQRGQ